jgi:arylsulfatase A-like enzyme
MSRAALPAAALAGLLGACAAQPPPAPPAPARHVVVVVLDTARAAAFSCYGNPRPLTPRVDALAAEGTLFRAAYAPCFWTLPSHGALLTGLYPSRAGSTSESNHLPETALTLAERLAAEGWATGAFVRNAWLTRDRGFGQGFEVFVEGWREDGGRSEFEGERAAVDEALAWLAREAGAGRRCFLLVNLNLAHMPYTPPEELRTRFLRDPPEPARLDRLTGLTGGWGHLAGRLELDARDYAALRDLYEAEVHLADGLAGRLVDGLEGLGLSGQTLLVVTSDHGENVGEHGMIDHVYSMYETTVRIPLVVRFPGRVRAGGTVDALASLVDLAPTVLDAAGVAAAADGFDGVSLLGPGPAGRGAVFAENGRPVNGVELLRRHFPEFDPAAIDRPQRMARAGGHKLIWNVGLSAELYDLAADPGELVDLSAARVGLRNDLLDLLRGFAAGLPPAPLRTPPVDDPEAMERLRALGYLR